jgi:hypothetical protein
MWWLVPSANVARDKCNGGLAFWCVGLGGYCVVVIRGGSFRHSQSGRRQFSGDFQRRQSLFGYGCFLSPIRGKVIPSSSWERATCILV